ncbi:SURF1 family protein [Nocardioides gilvus]|uniref:SURF1 family cytochrome oxidase biogenesis protein n=1 Tax=Nocardioides gilvus TaxID=1735589 RepID=UPI000D75024A|nr:SURF1 family protein [Nocardioides gilvus]
MQRLAFLLSRRWGLFFLIVILLTWLAVWLGQWQFDRLEDRRERNEIILRNEAMDPVPVETIMAVGEAVSDDEQWSIVKARGTYVVEDSVYVRYRTHKGRSGVQVTVPLDLGNGTSLLVDRGWWATQNRGEVPTDVPAPPGGEVEIVGRVRIDATGDATKVTEQSTRAISSVQISEAIDRPLLGGFVELVEETPDPEVSLKPIDEPEVDEGPHFFYGIQWWFFGALAVFGFFYLLYDEWRDRRDEPTADSEGAQDPTVDGERHAVHE